MVVDALSVLFAVLKFTDVFVPSCFPLLKVRIPKQSVQEETVEKDSVGLPSHSGRAKLFPALNMNMANVGALLSCNL